MSYILSELYYEWFGNPQYWFDKKISNDIYLTNKYFNYINKIYLENNLKQEIIGAIILLDQIPRHQNRILQNSLNIDYYSSKAIFYSELAIKLYGNKLNIAELCFIYLPYRHILDIDKIKYIIYRFINIYKYTTTTEYNKNLAKKYIINTLNNIYIYYNKFFIKISELSNITNNINFNLNILENNNMNIINDNNLINNDIYKEIYNSYIKLKKKFYYNRFYIWWC